MSNQKPLQIISAIVENFKKVEVVQITPDGKVIEITGQNEQGKSSILDAIEAAIGGKRHQPLEPIRRGSEDGARVVLDLGELVIERRWTQNSDRLVVKSKDGATFGAGQAKLDALGAVMFDPLAFMGEKPPAQREILLGLAGLDLEEIAGRRLTAYTDRREAGRLLKRVEARLSAAPEASDGTPREELDLGDLSQELREALSLKDENSAKRLAAADASTAQRLAADDHANQLETIEHLAAELEEAKKKCESLAKLKTSKRSVASRARAAAKDLPEPDVEGIQVRMEQVDEINREVRKLSTRADLAFEVKRLKIEVEDAQSTIDAIDQEKADALAAAPMPIEGLAVTEDGVTYQGLPLAQASMSRRVRVCTAIGAALAPDLRIALVRAGNDLDEKSLKAFYEYCEEAGLQAWVERISGITEDAIVIEAGRIAEGG